MVHEFLLFLTKDRVRLIRGKSGISIWLAMVVCAMAIPTHAATTATFELGTPTISGTSAEFDVIFTFTPDGGTSQAAVFFELDVSTSDSVLSAGDTDYSGFSFLPASPLLDAWSLAADFADPFLFLPTIVMDTFTFPGEALVGGPHLLGTLVVDLGAVAPGSDVTVSIEGLSTIVGSEDPPGSVSTFAFVDPEFPNGKGSATFTVPVPLPAAAWMGMSLLVGLTGVSAIRKRKTFVLCSYR